MKAGGPYTFVSPPTRRLWREFHRKFTAPRKPARQSAKDYRRAHDTRPGKRPIAGPGTSLPAAAGRSPLRTGRLVEKDRLRFAVSAISGDWRLETGDWRLETGDWRLERILPRPASGKQARRVLRARDDRSTRQIRHHVASKNAPHGKNARVAFAAAPLGQNRPGRVAHSQSPQHPSPLRHQECRRQASSSTVRQSGDTKLTISERRMPLIGRWRKPCQLCSLGMKMKPMPRPNGEVATWLPSSS